MRRPGTTERVWQRFNRARTVALAPCIAGMAVLIAPLAGAGIPIGLQLALGTGASRAAGTVYLGRLPAMTASLGILSAPVVGVISTVVLRGEWPTVPDMAGFALIFAASACVLLPSRETVAPEPA